MERLVGETNYLKKFQNAIEGISPVSHKCLFLAREQWSRA